MLRFCAPSGRTAAAGLRRLATAATNSIAKLTIGDLLAKKVAGRMRTVSRTTPIVEAVRYMYEGGSAGTVLAVESGIVVGSVNEKDYVCGLTHGASPPTNVTVEQIMLTDMQVAQKGTPLIVAVQSMLSRGRRHIPVVTDELAASLTQLPAPLPLSGITNIISLRDINNFISEVAMREDEAAKGGEGESGGELPWKAHVSTLLTDMKARGAKILLNTRLDDNISVADAANVMAERNMTCVAVVNDEGLIVGVFTARDFLTRIVLKGVNASDTKVRDVMTREPHAADLDRSILKCARSMAKRNFRHLPIVDDKNHGRVVGLVSLADVARAFTVPFGGVPPKPTPAAASEGHAGHVVSAVLPTTLA